MTPKSKSELDQNPHFECTTLSFTPSTMMNVNLAVLDDKSRDVDADLRFMALEDFQKYLNDTNTNKNMKNLEKFIPRLHQLLSDEATEVQNQAVKSFAPLLPYINDDIVFGIIETLFQQVLDINNKEKSNNNSFKKFTTSIPNMALRSIFNSNNYKFNEEVSRNILGAVAGEIFDNQGEISIDLIEILIDVFKALGRYLTLDEISQYLIKLVSISFQTNGITRKRTVVAFGVLISQLIDKTVEDGDVETRLNDLIEDINVIFETNTTKSIDDISHRFMIYQVFLHNIKNNKKKFAEFKFTNFELIFKIINEYINVEALKEVELDLEDLDLDLIVQENSIREDALITLNDLVVALPNNDYESRLSEVLSIIDFFIHYDPLNANVSNDEDEYENSMEESDIEFSDDDEDDENNNLGDDENDGSASKLRIQSINLIKNIIISNHDYLPIIYDDLIYELIKTIDDRIISVSNEAIKTIIIIINLTPSLNLNSSNNDGPTGRQRARSDVSMIDSESNSPTNKLIFKITPILEEELFGKLMVEKNLNRFPIFIKLLESIISKISNNLSDEFIGKIFANLEEFNFTATNNLENLNLHRIIITKFEINRISISFIKNLITNLSNSINDNSTYHNFILESLTIIDLLVNKLTTKEITILTNIVNDILVDTIVIKILNKQYSSDLRQSALQTLSQIVINFELNDVNFGKVVGVFKECLNFEVTVNYTIENLITILSNANNNTQRILSDQAFVAAIVQKILAFLSSSDTTLYLNSLILFKLLPTLNQSHNLQYDKLAQYLVKIIDESSDFRTINLSIDNLTEVLRIEPGIIDEVFYANLIKMINKNFIDISLLDLKTFKQLIFIINAHGRDKFDIFQISLHQLNLRLYITSIILKIIVIENGFADFIQQCESELKQYLQKNNHHDDKIDKIVFDIHFLGDVSRDKPVSITLDDFYKILEQSNNELISLATSRAIGLFIDQDLVNYLPNLIEKYKQQEANIDDHNKNQLLLLSIKQILTTSDNLNEGLLQLIWDQISLIINNKSADVFKKSINELKILGDILYHIIRLNGQFIESFIGGIENSQTQLQIYTNVVIVKSLIGDKQFFNEQVCHTKQQFLIDQLLSYQQILNIDIKQAIISILLTGVHNKVEIFIENLGSKILPTIFEELTAQECFKKTIPMGPYKYIIDEGLEIRKLSYELLYTIIVNEEEIDIKSGLNFNQVFENILVKGLNDLENDIIILSCINLINLINKFGIDYFFNNQEFSFDLLTELLTKQINKKLRSKPSTQEMESFEEGLKSVVKLSKVINSNLCDNNNNISPQWKQYYHDMKSKHLIIYRNIEV